MSGRSYEDAGVSIERGAEVTERLRAAVESTGADWFGGFAALHPLDDSRLLAASTDSVGTKLVLARQRGALRACGADLAAHCINDVITCGAEPLVLLDYVAANRIDPEQVVELVEGAAEACRAAGVALIGGETAELPDVYAEGELDFAGTCVGTVSRDDVIDGSRVAAGDVVIGLPSAGVHANGFTLVRRILETDDYDGPTSSRPRASISTTCASSVAALMRLRTSPAAASSATSSACSLLGCRRRSTGAPGNGRLSSRGSPSTSPSSSSDACSTSGSATSPSSPSPATAS